MPPFQSPKRSKGALTQTSFVVLRSKVDTQRAPPCASLGRFLLDLVQGACRPETPNPQKQKKSKVRAPPAVLRGVRHVAGGWGKSTPSHQPGVLGSFLGVMAKPLRGRCASLDPIHRQCPPSPCAGLWRVFRVKGGSRGWCGPQPRRGEDTAPDATGATQACRQGVGAPLPRHPCPRREAPRQPPEALVRRAVQGAPPPGFQGRAAPWA